jgi:hypothetical protein
MDLICKSPKQIQLDLLKNATIQMVWTRFPIPLPAEDFPHATLMEVGNPTLEKHPQQAQ